jgi:hypothetical protein
LEVTVIERERIRIVESSDDRAAVSFEDSDLPILEWVDGWALFYLDEDRTVRDHLVLGAVDDLDLAVRQARDYLDRRPRNTAWPHN